jgi:molecular chaperone GrpE
MSGDGTPEDAVSDKVSEAAERALADEKQDENREAAELALADEKPGGADERIARLEDQLRRTAADLDNLRKRYQRDLDRERSAERARAANAWLPIVDNLELALQHADSDPEAVVQGIRAVHEQAVATLGRLGFPVFDPVGQPFDPALQEAVSTLVDEKAAPGTVVAVVRPGYGTADALLRPASVVVAKQ